MDAILDLLKSAFKFVLEHSARYSFSIFFTVCCVCNYLQCSNLSTTSKQVSAKGNFQAVKHDLHNSSSKALSVIS